jgi:CBS domain-containing protein
MLVNGVLGRKGSAVVTVTPGAIVSDAVGLLRRHRIGALVVSDDGRNIVGILSERDVVAGLADEGPSLLHRPVAEVMTADPICCHLDDTTEQLMAVMTHRRVRHLPVEHNGELIGLVSIGDVVLQRVQELESEKQVLHDYISQGR